MHRRTFLAGIAAALATYAVPGMPPGPRVLTFASTAGTLSGVVAAAYVTLTGHDAQGRLITETIAVPENGEVASAGAFKDYRCTITLPARVQKDVPITFGYSA